jgi:glycosyltransferase involved in cell wall biosynthesis
MTQHLVPIFAYHYPPENEVGAARPFRFSKYLSRLGYTCRVFTAAKQTGRSDPNTEYVPDPCVASSGHAVETQLERVFRKAFLPGETGMQWAIQASRAARTWIRGRHADRVTILSTYPPFGSHLAAWRLSRSEKYPWIADFRDSMRNEHTSMNFLHQSLNRWLECRLVKGADVTIANTDAALARLQKTFPSESEKIQLIWNGFDPEERVLPLPGSSGDRKVLSHTGELYGGRSAVPILESLGRLIDAGRISAGNVRLRLIGPAQAGTLPHAELLTRAQDEGWLELVTEQIPKIEALEIARSSDCLLLLQLQSAVHVPAKLFEYLQIGRPILAFLMANSPAERLLIRSGVPYRCVYPGSTREIIDNTVADFLSIQGVTVPVSAWFEENFNAQNQTRQLDAIIRSLHSDAKR